MNLATNIVLTGFMGTGKTTVGQILARKLNREFVDMDAVIEARAGMSIPQIFERRKARTTFRELERRLGLRIGAAQRLGDRNWRRRAAMDDDIARRQ